MRGNQRPGARAEELTAEIEENCSLYSDLYKDLHGVRPDLARFRKLTVADQRDEIDHVSSTLADEIAAEEDYDPEPYDLDDYPEYDPYAGSSGPDYWQNDAGEWCCG